MRSKNTFRYILASLITVSFFGLLIVLVYRAIPAGNKDILNLIIGALIGAFLTIVNYEWGSSKGSSEKTEMLKKQE